MNFEHIVIVNDPRQPLAAPLSRDQVWAGLLHRVEDSRPFLSGLDSCEVLSREHGVFTRRLTFGATEIHDRVTLAAGEWVRFTTEPSATHRGGTLTIAIEEHREGELALRFSYASIHAVGHEAEDAAYEPFLKQAYEAADIDTVRVIRLLATTTGVAN